ncbi:MAG TPA: hypothetical protein VGD74_02005, partial [Vulgatibacter sp.]
MRVREFFHELSRAGGEQTQKEPCARSARESIVPAEGGAIDSQALRVREFFHELSRAGGEQTQKEPCARESIASASRGA